MKKILKIVGGVLLLIIVAALAVPLFISADYLKTQLASQVKQATGRTLTMKGKASIALFPSIAVKLEDVTLGNPAGFSGSYFANVKTLSVGAELKPLLHKQVKVTGITVDGATLNLEQAASGATNWDFSNGKKAATTDTKDGKSVGSGPSPLIIDAIKIRNTTVSYRKFGAQTVRFDAKDIDADITMQGAATKVALTNMALYDGHAKANVKLDSQTKNMALGLTLDAIQLDPLMVALTGASKMTGKATMQLDVTGKNAEQAAMMRSLNGAGSIKILDGAIKGINVASFLREAKNGFVLGNSSTESTDFTELTASYKITGGIVNNDDLAMKSPVLRLGGKGTINLAAQTINYRAVPSIVGTLKGQGGKDKLSGGGLDIPLLITGPWSAISVTPDIAGLLQDALKNPDALKQNIQDITGDLFGKKKAAPAAAVTAPAGATSAPVNGEMPATTPAPAPEPKKQKLNDAIGGLLQGLGK